MEQGFDITLYEQNDFLGGKLGAYRVGGKSDPHEHCYHMYLNWYNNFWQLMREIGAIEISDGFSLVEVPESRAQDIIAALKATKLRGAKRGPTIATVWPTEPSASIQPVATAALGWTNPVSMERL